MTPDTCMLIDSAKNPNDSKNGDGIVLFIIDIILQILECYYALRLQSTLFIAY